MVDLIWFYFQGVYLRNYRIMSIIEKAYLIEIRLFKSEPISTVILLPYCQCSPYKETSIGSDLYWDTTKIC